jgi:CheY-like chemotaxis protein
MNRTAAEARHAMLAAFGHELRAPLARILHLSQEGGAGEAIAACARQQLELIDDLLDYTRGQVRPAELVAAPTYLHALMRQAADEAAPLARAAGCALVLRVEENVPPLAVLDARRIRQMLRKLVLRAAHRAAAAGAVHAAHDVPADHGAAPAHDAGAAPRIVLALRAPSSAAAPSVSLRFSVALNGGAVFGLSAWLPFGDDAQAPAGDENRGDALGLALAAQLAQGMQTVLDTSTGEDGAEIFFTLATTAATEAEAMLPQAGFDVPPCGDGGRILLVDSQPAMLDYLTELLDGAGYEVDCAASGEAALAQQKAAPAHLIVCAQQPPLVDAWALLRALRGAGDAAPVIVHALAPPRPPADWAGGDAPAAVLYRPAPAPALLQAIRESLEGKPGARR